jgi:SSS family solute:Na+ symporter
LVYYLAGGLKAVVYTQAVQTGVLLAGCLSLTIAGLIKLHGFMHDAGMTGSFIENFMDLVRPGQMDVLHSNASIRNLTSRINNEYSHFGFDSISGSGLTWYAAFLGYPILGLWYWCSDQTIVQEVLAAKTKDDAQRGPIFAGFLKLLTPFIMILPGIIAFVLFKQEIFNSARSASVSKPGDMALVFSIDRLLPTGLQGLFAAALMAALMSTIAAALNSISTLVSVDIYKRINPNVNEKRLVYTGRISAIVIMILATFWSTQGDKFSSVFEAINKVAAALSPPVATVLLFGVLYKKGTKEASLVTLITGLILGIAVFILDFKFSASGTSIVTESWGIPFMMQAWWLFCICVIIYLVVSKFTRPPEQAIIEKYTWESPAAVFKGRFTGIKDIRFLILILVIALITLFILLS